jgi:hypothetical protein
MWSKGSPESEPAGSLPKTTTSHLPRPGAVGT